MGKVGNVEVEWSGGYLCLCHGKWTLKVDGRDVSDKIPEDLKKDDMNTYKSYRKWHFNEDYREEWEYYNDGLRCEDWIEDLLIDSLMDYWMYEDLGLCGCGCPEYTFEVIRKYLHIRQDWRENKLTYNEVIDKYRRDLHIDDNDNNQFGLLQFMMYILDEHGFTEHGISITRCWLTEKGEMLLATLDAWHEKNTRIETD